ncbi:MAG: hypothetical protein V4664_01300 [Patescibacteria group bacterium]
MPITKNSGFGFLGVIILVALVVALGGGVYYSSKKALEVARENNEQATTSVSVEGKSTTNANISAGVEVGVFTNGSIRSLLSAGRDLECSVSFSTTTAKGIIKTEGAVFISGNSMRGDFTMSGGASSTTSAHIIREGDTVTAWTGKRGAMMSLSSVTTAGNNSAQVDLDQNISYKCMPWSKDVSKFTVPTDVKIYDISTMINSGINLQIKK